MGLQGWIDEFTRSGAREPIPRTYHVMLAPELVRALEVYAATTNHKPETIIAEAVRAYLGVDQ
jgi:predicted transcriptional regulator